MTTQKQKTVALVKAQSIVPALTDRILSDEFVSVTSEYIDAVIRTSIVVVSIILIIDLLIGIL